MSGSSAQLPTPSPLPTEPPIPVDSPPQLPNSAAHSIPAVQFGSGGLGSSVPGAAAPNVSPGAAAEAAPHTHEHLHHVTAPDSSAGMQQVLLEQETSAVGAASASAKGVVANVCDRLAEAGTRASPDPLSQPEAATLQNGATIAIATTAAVGVAVSNPPEDDNPDALGPSLQEARERIRANLAIRQHQPLNSRRGLLQARGSAELARSGSLPEPSQERAEATAHKLDGSSSGSFQLAAEKQMHEKEMSSVDREATVSGTVPATGASPEQDVERPTHGVVKSGSRVHRGREKDGVPAKTQGQRDEVRSDVAVHATTAQPHAEFGSQSGAGGTSHVSAGVHVLVWWNCFPVSSCSFFSGTIPDQTGNLGVNQCFP